MLMAVVRVALGRCYTFGVMALLLLIAGCASAGGCGAIGRGLRARP